MAIFLAEVRNFLYRKWLNIVTSMGGRTRKSSRLVEVRNWEDLTTDCLINIFERLGLESLILDIPFVCKSWYKVSLDPHCWKVLDFQFMSLKRSPWAITVVEEKSWSGIKHSNATPFTKFMKIAVNRSDGLATKLVFHTCIFYDNILEYVLERCPALKTLILPAADLVGYYNCYFDDLTKKNNKCILKMISKLKNLESLMNLWSLPGCQFEKLLKQIHIHCPNFESLGFRNSLSDDVASAIVTLAPNIKHLVLRDSTVHRENLILILSGCRKLELLDATNCRGFDVDDTEILKMASHLILKVPNHGFLSRAAEKWWLSY